MRRQSEARDRPNLSRSSRPFNVLVVNYSDSSPSNCTSIKIRKAFVGLSYFFFSSAATAAKLGNPIIYASLYITTCCPPVTRSNFFKTRGVANKSNNKFCP